VRKNGETNPVTILVFLLIGVAAFYVYHVGPLYMDNLDAKGYVAEAFNQYFIDGEEKTRARLMMTLNEGSPGTSHYEVDEDGVESIKPGYGLKDENVTFTYNESTRVLRVRVEYDRIVEFKPFKKRKTYHLIAEKVGKRSQ